MAKASPAFQWYPDDFEQGTATFTLSEVGGYMRLLNHQWANGSVPGDDVKALSRIMRCTVTSAKLVWKTIGGKFPIVDGRYRNPRMECERQKQAERRAALAESGKRGGEAKAANIASLQPKPSLVSPSLSPSLSSSSQQQIPAAAASGGPRKFDKTHAGHVFGFCGFKCLSDEKLNEFARDLPGGQGDPENYGRVLAWAEQLRDAWGAKPKVEFEWWLFWQNRWKERMEDAALEQYRPAGSR